MKYVVALEPNVTIHMKVKEDFFVLLVKMIIEQTTKNIIQIFI